MWIRKTVFQKFYGLWKERTMIQRVTMGYNKWQLVVQWVAVSGTTAGYSKWKRMTTSGHFV